jgi:hypothetical protein
MIAEPPSHNAWARSPLAFLDHASAAPVLILEL